MFGILIVVMAGTAILLGAVAFLVATLFANKVDDKIKNGSEKNRFEEERL